MAKTSAPPSNPEASQKAHQQEMDDFDTRDHLNTIVKAHQIMQDPVKMKKIKKHLGTQKQAFNSLKDVQNYANQKYGGPGGSPQPGTSPDSGDDMGD